VLKLKTINVVRNREKIGELKCHLTHLGADVVLTEEEARQAWRELPRPCLALNCVGGASGTELCKALAEGGVHVTYGGMSLKPVIAATSHLIFKVLQIFRQQMRVFARVPPSKLVKIQRLLRFDSDTVFHIFMQNPNF
jgi:trans-2-enoyl-CoA reductase